jgi:hypothetical protein
MIGEVIYLRKPSSSICSGRLSPDFAKSMAVGSGGLAIRRLNLPPAPGFSKEPRVWIALVEEVFKSVVLHSFLEGRIQGSLYAL